MKMRKTVAVFLSVLCLTTAFASCGKDDKKPPVDVEVNPKSWTKNLIKLLVNEFCIVQGSFLLVYKIFSRCCNNKCIHVVSQ